MTRLDPQDYHVPVMAQQCLDLLSVRADGLYVDATLGGGGHTDLILRAGGSLISFDADEVAIARCEDRFADLLGSKLEIVHANFVTMADNLKDRVPIDGVLFDLGVSSFQFDHHERGFSYRHNAPLDMRFGTEGTTAADLLNTLSQEDISAVFRNYGEDPSAWRLAGAIVRRRGLAPYKTTFELRDTIVQHIPPQHHNKTLARIFQALRIAVNSELDNLKTALVSVLPLMNEGGRIVVMSYHSLEDRIVKDIFKAHTTVSEDAPQLKMLNKKPIMADEEEVARNPRGRSARLRAAEVVRTASYLRGE